MKKHSSHTYIRTHTRWYVHLYIRNNKWKFNTLCKVLAESLGWVSHSEVRIPLPLLQRRRHSWEIKVLFRYRICLHCGRPVVVIQQTPCWGEVFSKLRHYALKPRPSRPAPELSAPRAENGPATFQAPFRTSKVYAVFLNSLKQDLRDPFIIPYGTTNLSFFKISTSF